MAVTERRIGATDSKTRIQLLDAAERLMLTDGYAAVTSRRVAAEAELKPQLVHYYFRTMDDLFLEVFRRRAEANLERFDDAIAADPSLPNLWRLTNDPRGAAFTVEFAALSNHRKEIRAEVAAYAERFRVKQMAALKVALQRNDPGGVPAEAVLLLMTGLSQIIGIERNLGVTTGHAKTMTFIDRMVRHLDADA